MPAATGLQPLLAGQAPTPARPGGMRCCLPGLAFVPALLVSWSSAAFIVSYVIAVLEGHVQPLVPYIR